MPDFNVYINKEGAYKKVPVGRENEFLSKYPGSRQATKEEISIYDRNRYAGGVLGASAAVTSTQGESNAQETPSQPPNNGTIGGFTTFKDGTSGFTPEMKIPNVKLQQSRIDISSPGNKTEAIAPFGNGKPLTESIGNTMKSIPVSPKAQFDISQSTYKQEKDWIKEVENDPSISPEVKKALIEDYNKNIRISENSIDVKDLPLYAKQWLKDNEVDVPTSMYVQGSSMFGGGKYVEGTKKANTPEQISFIKDFIANTPQGQDIVKRQNEYVNYLENSISEVESRIPDLKKKYWQDLNDLSSSHPYTTGNTHGKSETDAARQDYINKSKELAKRMSALSLAEKNAEDHKKLLSAIKDGDLNVLSQFGKQIGRDFGEMAGDIGTLGIRPMMQSLYELKDVKELQRRIDNKEPISEEDRLAMFAMANNQAYQELMGDKRTISQEVASGITQSAPFMITFATTGGVGKAVTGGVKELLKQGIKRNAINAIRSGAEASIEKIGARLAGFGLNVADATARASVMAAISPQTYRDMFDNMRGNVTYGYDKDGKPYYLGNVEQMDITKALLNAWGSNTIENVSEFSGFGMEKGQATLSRLLKQRVPEVSKVLSLGSARNEFFQGVNKAIEQAGFNGTVNEYLEEQVATVLHSFFEDGQAQWSDLVDPRQQFITFLTVASIGSGSAILNTSGNQLMKYGAKKAYNNAFQDFGTEFYNSQNNDIARIFADKMRNGTIEEKQSALSNIVDSDLFNDKQKLAALNLYRSGLIFESYEGSKQAQIDEAVKEIPAIIEENVNPKMGSVIHAIIAGMDTPVQIADGAILQNEDGSIDREKSDQTIYYTDSDGKRQVTSIKNIENITENIPAQDAIDQVTEQVAAPIIAQQDNEEVRPYQAGETVRFSPDGNTSLIGQISGQDQTTGNYLLLVETPNGIQQMQVEPRQIINEDNLQGVENGSPVIYTNQNGQQIKDVVATTPDLYLQGLIGFENGDVVPISNVIGLAQNSETGIPVSNQDTNNVQTISQQNEDITLPEQSNVKVNESRVFEIGDGLSATENTDGTYSIDKQFPKSELKKADNLINKLNEDYSDNGLVFELVQLPKQDASNPFEKPLWGVVARLQQEGPTTQTEISPQNRENEHLWNVAENSDNPIEISSAYNEAMQSAGEEILQEWQKQLIGRKINRSSFERFGDRNYINGTIARSWFNRKGEETPLGTIDVVAQELGVTEQDIIDFIINHPSNRIKKGNELTQALNDKFRQIAREVTGREVGGIESNSGKLFLSTLEYAANNTPTNVEVEFMQSDVITNIPSSVEFFLSDYMNLDEISDFNQFRDAVEEADKQGYFMFPLEPKDKEVILNYINNAERQANAVQGIGEDVSSQQIHENVEAESEVENPHDVFLRKLTEVFPDSIKLYHRTTPENWKSIQNDGFIRMSEHNDGANIGVHTVMEDPNQQRVGYDNSILLEINVPVESYNKLYPEEATYYEDLSDDDSVKFDNYDMTFDTYMKAHPDFRGGDIVYSEDIPLDMVSVYNPTSSESKEKAEHIDVAIPEYNGNIVEYIKAVGKNVEVSKAESATNTNPTEAQKEAGNYKKGKVTIQGLDISIEQPRGSVRSGTDQNGKEWSIEMQNTYGYIGKTKSRDGDHIDVFLGNNPESKTVFVVDQINQDQSFDEHKVMLGFDSIEQAREAYLSNYEEGWQGLGNITQTDIDTFKKWAKTDGRRIKPFADYKSIQGSKNEGSDFDISNYIGKELYHGSPDGEITKIDPYAHTQNWKEGIGFYTTDSKDKAQEYANGKTANSKRKSDKGAITKITFPGDVKVLNMDARVDIPMWEDISKNLGIETPLLSGSNLDAYNELISSYNDELGTTEGQYAIEEALLDYGYDVSTHMEGLNSTPHRVFIWKNEFKLPYIGEVRLQSTNNVFKPINEQTFNLLVDRLRKTGLSRDVITDKAAFDAKLDEVINDNATAKQTLSEMDTIKQEAIANGTFMLAPNGKPTKLNENQWLQVRTKPFLNWFGDWINNPRSASKVVDDNGEPMVVYHGTTQYDEITKFRRGTKGYLGGGMYFTSDKSNAERYARKNGWEGRMYETFLYIKDPIVVNGSVGTDKLLEAIYGSDKIYKRRNAKQSFDTMIIKRSDITKMQDAGYDGVIWGTADEYVVYDPTQIKSAISNNGEFDSRSSDIRMQLLHNPRTRLTNVRGGWTKNKILKQLKEAKKSVHNYGLFSVVRGIAQFDTAKELRDHLFYHGTGGGVYGGLYPSITLSEREAARNGGGGYGDRYWAISVSKSKRKASIFSGQSRSVSIYPVILNKDAKVVDMPELQDSAELEDIIEDLWNQGVDAVRLGNWKDKSSEQELAVINPYAISTFSRSETHSVYGMNFNDIKELSDEELQEVIDNSKYAIEQEQAFVKENRPVQPLHFDNSEIPQRRAIREEWKRKLDSFQRDLISDIRFYQNNVGDVYGFVTPDGTVYLDSTRMNANTPIHEFGHLWNSFIKENNTDLYNRGAELVKESEYWQRVNDNPSYRNLSDEAKVDEALAMAIGDKGEAIVNRNLKQRFVDWLSDVWKSIKEVFGIKTDVAIEDMPLSEFISKASNELLSGKNISNTEDRRNSNTRYQFVGKQGAENLDKVEEATIRIDNLQVAREMENANKDAKSIKLATGWERGADGKWRYEIPDSQTTQKFKDLDIGESISLEEALVDKKLFIAYPDLKDVNVEIVDTRLEGGSWNPSYKTIELSAYLPAYKNGKLQSDEIFDVNAIDEGFRNVLIHEIQHAIQDIEGFARGGSISSSEIGLSRMNDFLKKYPEFSEYNKSVLAMSEDESDMSALNKAIELSSNLDEELMSEYNKLLINTIGISEYNRLAGEVEARNVQSRMNMTLDERINSLAEDTEDVARKDQIFINNALNNNKELRYQSIPINSVNKLADATNSTMTEDMRNELDKRIKNLWFRIREAYEDRHLAVQKFLDVLRENGTEVAEHNDFYKKATHINGAIDAQLEQYNNKYQKPLNKAISELEKAGFDYRDIENYAILKHGLERNAWMKQDAINQYMANNPEATPEQIARFEQNLPDDFSGITAVEKEVGKHAEWFINDFEEKAGKDLIDNLWKRVKDATSYSLNKQLEGQLIDKKTIEDLKSRYDYYVPLRGHDAEVAEDRWDYSPDMGTYFVAPLLKAKGRKTRSESPFAYIASMAQSAINSANRNILNQTILRLALKDKTGMLNVNKAWYEKTGEQDGKPVYEVRSPEYNEDPETYRKNIEEFEERMAKLAEAGLAVQSGKKLDIGGLFIKRKQADQHEVHVFQNGTEYVVYINANPAVARAINGSNAKDLHKDLRFFARVSRQMAANFTTRNPIFVASNFSRDYIFSSSILPVKENAKYALQFQRNMLPSADALQRYVRGKADLNKQQDRYLNEYILNGAKTGFSHILELQKVQKQIERDIKKGEGRNVFRYLLDGLEGMNEFAENLSRLSVYITSREQGRSITQSVSDAKEVTVNFNRSGTGGFGAAWFRSLYLFINAGIQALSNFAKVAQKNKAKTAMLISSYAMSGFLMPILTSLIGGDDGLDDYLKLSDWERQNNLCIYTGNGFIKIPLPHELRVFHKMGDEIYQSTFGKKDVTQSLLETVLGFSDLVPSNPMGAIQGSWADIMPDATKPFFQLAANRNFTGSRITNEWADPNKPGYLRVRTNKKGEPFAPAFLVKLAETLDNTTGGDGVEKGIISLNPDVINHLMRGYFGGLYNMGMQSLDLSSKTYDWSKSGEFNLKVRETPLKTFYTSESDLQTSSSGLNSKYFKIVDDTQEAIRKIKGYKEQVKNGKLSVVEFSKKIENMDVPKTNDLYGRIKQIKKYESALKDLDGKDQKDLEKIISDRKKEVIEVNNKLSE